MPGNGEEKMGYHVVLENSLGCELDGRYAKNDTDIRDAIVALLDGAILADGDVIRVIEAKNPRDR